MIVSIGTDLVAIARIEGLLARRGEAFVERVFTPAERAYCESRARPGESFAARFAAKEAVMKCLGTGFGRGIAFCDVGVARAESGAVAIELTGGAANRAQTLGIGTVLITLSHTEDHALAFAVATSSD